MVDFLKKIFGTKNERELKRLFKVVDEINSLEPAFSALSSEQLSAKTGEFRNLLSHGKSLDDIFTRLLQW